MDSGSKEIPNRRAQKSLGLLCSNFLYLYNTEGVETIELDDAAARLGVERRRIYDIVNDSISWNVLVNAKNKYIWKGFEAIPKALDNLKEEGLTNVRENSSGTSRSEKFSDDNDDEEEACSDVNLRQKSSAPSKVWKENCLGLLTRNFIKLFLCTDMEMISLDDAAKLLLGDVKHTSMTNKTTVRRLANVLSSLNIVEKIYRPHTKKSAFKWLGVASTSHHETDDDPRNEACNDKTREGIDCKSLASTSRPQYHTQALKDLFHTLLKHGNCGATKLLGRAATDASWYSI